MQKELSHRRYLNDLFLSLKSPLTMLPFCQAPLHNIKSPQTMPLFYQVLLPLSRQTWCECQLPNRECMSHRDLLLLTVATLPQPSRRLTLRLSKSSQGHLKGLQLESTLNMLPLSPLSWKATADKAQLSVSINKCLPAFLFRDNPSTSPLVSQGLNS